MGQSWNRKRELEKLVVFVGTEVVVGAGAYEDAVMLMALGNERGDGGFIGGGLCVEVDKYEDVLNSD